MSLSEWKRAPWERTQEVPFVERDWSFLKCILTWHNACSVPPADETTWVRWWRFVTQDQLHCMRAEEKVTLSKEQHGHCESQKMLCYAMWLLCWCVSQCAVNVCRNEIRQLSRCPGGKPTDQCHTAAHHGSSNMIQKMHLKAPRMSRRHLVVILIQLNTKMERANESSHQFHRFI